MTMAREVNGSLNASVCGAALLELGAGLATKVAEFASAIFEKLSAPFNFISDYLEMRKLDNDYYSAMGELTYYRKQQYGQSFIDGKIKELEEKDYNSYEDKDIIDRDIESLQRQRDINYQPTIEKLERQTIPLLKKQWIDQGNKLADTWDWQYYDHIQFSNGKAYSTY
jgi:hypothetical protein